MPKVNMDEKKRTYQNTSAGIAELKLDGNYIRIKGGKTFRARPSEISKGFRDVIKEAPSHAEVDVVTKVSKKDKKAAEKIENTAADKARPEFDIVAVEGAPGWFNVVNKASGKVMNENKKLRAEEAQDLVKSLSEGSE